jgi:hypothetical protein
MGQEIAYWLRAEQKVAWKNSLKKQCNYLGVDFLTAMDRCSIIVNRFPIYQVFAVIHCTRFGFSQFKQRHSRTST